MKRNTIWLLFWAAVAYGVLLILARGLFPPDTTPTVSLTGIPLIVTIVMIIRDLTRRSTTPTDTRPKILAGAFKGSPVEFLSGQIIVAASASDSYFDDMVRARLKELLVSKAALETGLDNATVRQLLSDHKQGPKLLHQERLYQLLYGRVPEKGRARLKMIEDSAELIEAWKG